MRNKGKRKRKYLIIAMVLTIVMTGSSVAGAYTTTTSGTTTISPSNSQFKSAKNPMYDSKSEWIRGNISKSYNMDIYHYECQEGGYYQVYTTGSLDTVGAVYEEQNSLTKTSYKRRAHNDVGKITGVDNCSMVVDMDKWEDYYVCVRGYGAKTGTYYVNIEPNEDKVFNKNYGVWDCQNTPASSVIGNTWTSRKIYLNKEHAILLYWTLEPATVIEFENNTYTMQQIKTLYNRNPSEVVSMLSKALGMTMKLANQKAIGITINMVGTILSKKLVPTKSDEQLMREKLISICGVKQIANAKTWEGKWSASYGMLVTETYYNNNILDPYMYTYSRYNCTDTLKGVKWYYGTWNH